MVAIPQITRDRLASSVVGTPGVDTSGAKIEGALSQTGQEIGATVGNYLDERQRLLDSSQANSLVAQGKIAKTSLLEQYKTQYVNDPDQALKDFWPAANKIDAAVADQADNPRAKLLAQQKDPMYDGRIADELGRWSFTQKIQNNYKDATNQTVTLGNSAAQIGGDTSQPIEARWKKFTDLFSPLGNTITSMKGMQSDETIDKFTVAAKQDLTTGFIHGLMDTEPWNAKTTLMHPEVKAMLGEERWEKLNASADSAVQHFAQKQQLNQMFDTSVENNNLMRYAATGKDENGQPFNFAAIDKLRQINGNRPIYDYLEKNLLAPKSADEKAEDVMNFYSQAHQIGMQFRRGPANASLEQLVDFNTNLTKAKAEGTISNETYLSMTNKLSGPLTDAIMKTHDIDKYQAVQQKKGIMGWLFGQKEPAEVHIDKYNGGYNAINNWFEAQGQTNNVGGKAQAIKKYMDLMDTMKDTDKDFYGRAWTPQTLARKAMGVGDGDTIDTPFGPKVITGADSKGIPKYEITQDEMDKMNRLKALRAQ